MSLQLLPQKAIKLGNAFIIADLHLGFEESLARGGAYLPRAFDEMVSSLKGLLMKEKPKILVINGDLKHSFIPFKREQLELRAFLEEIFPLVSEIVVVKGNHDVGISWIRGFGVEVVKKLEVKGYTITHGHQLVEGNKFIIGHEHPAIGLRDEVGALIKVPIFLVSDDLTVLPAFTPWAYGNNILRGIVSPYLEKFDIRASRILVPLEDEILDFGTLEKLVEALRKI